MVLGSWSSQWYTRVWLWTTLQCRIRYCLHERYCQLDIDNMESMNVETARYYQSSTNTTTQHIHGTGVYICCFISNRAQNVLSRGTSNL